MYSERGKLNSQEAEEREEFTMGLRGWFFPALQQQGADSPGGAVAAQGYGAVHGIFFAVEDDELGAVAFGEGFKVGPVN